VLAIGCGTGARGQHFVKADGGHGTETAKNTWNGYLNDQKNPGVSPSECINCGYCERKCPQHLKVRELLKKVEGVLSAL
jgi:predicted aldo/keto reductase-like oxidoreductase